MFTNEGRNMKKAKTTFSVLIAYAILILVAVVTIFPIFSLIASSFKSSVEILTQPAHILPEKWTIEGYKRALESENFDFFRMAFNSMWYSAASVVINLFISAMSGYVFSRGQFRGKKVIFTVFSALMFISMGSVTTYPTLRLVSKLGLSNSLYGLLFVQCFGIPITNMYIVRGYMNSLPKELDEAAIIDGCSFASVLFRIHLPLLKPALSTIGILTFNAAWNSYLMPSIYTMNNPKRQPLMVGIQVLRNSAESATSWDILFAATTLSILPTLLVFAFFNKLMVDGVTSGSVKG